MKLKKFDLSGKEIGEVAIDEKTLSEVANTQMVKDYLVALHANARQWSANTKTRTEVNRTGAKPHAQKGLGRARQGCFAAPHFRGGGVSMGPKPKFDQHVKVNKKEKRKVITSLLIEKVLGNKAIVLELKDDEVKKTKLVDAFLNTTKLKGTRVLVLSKNGVTPNFKRSLRNIPKTDFVDIDSVNGYELSLSNNIIVIDSVLDEFKNAIKKSEKK